MITAKREDKEVTRNSSFFKKLDDSTKVKQEVDDDDDVTLETSPTTAPVILLDAPERRYPTRSSRRPPEYLKDYV